MTKEEAKVALDTARKLYETKRAASEEWATYRQANLIVAIVVEDPEIWELRLEQGELIARLIGGNSTLRLPT